MLKEYLFHQYQRAVRGEISNALYNCHTFGLNSIMLHDEPGNRIRMFMANAGALLNNDAINRSPMKIGIHNHHSDIQLIGIYGTVYNNRYDVMVADNGSLSLAEYTSKILTGKGSITDTGVKGTAFLRSREPLSANPRLSATELHTVSMDSHEDAAWLVIEGAVNRDYKPICWTNNFKVDFSSLYLNMPQTHIARTLHEALKKIS